MNYLSEVNKHWHDYIIVIYSEEEEEQKKVKVEVWEHIFILG